MQLCNFTSQILQLRFATFSSGSQKCFAILLAPSQFTKCKQLIRTLPIRQNFLSLFFLSSYFLKSIKKHLTGRSFKKLEFQQTQKSLIPVLLFITLQTKQKISAKLIQFDLNWCKLISLYNNPRFGYWKTETIFL